jgi:hypothetical protein
MFDQDGELVQDIDLSTGYWIQVVDSEEDEISDEEEEQPKVAEISDFSLFLHKITTN